MQLKSTKEKLLGSRRRGAKAECAAGSIKEIKRIFKRICREERKVQVNIFCLGDVSVEKKMRIAHADVAVGVAEKG